MKLLPISNFNSSKRAKQENVNFGIQLYVENSVSRFVYKKAADRAFALGHDAQKVLNETYAATMSLLGL